MLDELSAIYKPVPFNHEDHAKMALMWDGCKTCHHRQPQVTKSISLPFHVAPNQNLTMMTPKCSACHDPSVTASDVHMPNLKGALHRQCLNCHREWMHENACVICHAPRDPNQKLTASTAPTVDDIVGRIHPPIEAPDVKTYRPRFKPAVGTNIIFRHAEHTRQFGLKCVSCHHRDTCANCHDGAARTEDQKVMRPGRTWRDSHEPCVGCHAQDRCNTCHYSDGQTPPPPFKHEMTGQALDKDHANLKCEQCHVQLKVTPTLTCGDASCHKPGPKGPLLIAFPAQRPGSVIALQPTTKPAVVSVSAPTTKPTIIRIRSGGS